MNPFLLGALALGALGLYVSTKKPLSSNGTGAGTNVPAGACSPPRSGKDAMGRRIVLYFGSAKAGDSLRAIASRILGKKASDGDVAYFAGFQHAHLLWRYRGISPIGEASPIDLDYPSDAWADRFLDVIVSEDVTDREMYIVPPAWYPLFRLVKCPDPSTSPTGLVYAYWPSNYDNTGNGVVYPECASSCG